MKRLTSMRWIIPAVAAFGLAWGYSGRAQDPSTGQRVGEKIDDAVQDIKSDFKRAGNAAKEGFGKVKASVNNMSVESRVYGRIHWDKALNDASIDLSVSDDGVITLDGTVADLKAKAMAVKLTQETVGVTKVIDRLAVRPLTTTTTP